MLSRFAIACDPSRLGASPFEGCAAAVDCLKSARRGRRIASELGSSPLLCSPSALTPAGSAEVLGPRCSTAARGDIGLPQAGRATRLVQLVVGVSTEARERYAELLAARARGSSWPTEASTLRRGKACRRWPRGERRHRDWATMVVRSHLSARAL